MEGVWRLWLCGGAARRSCPLVSPGEVGRSGAAVRTRDRHVVGAPPSWGEAVALWVEVVPFTRREAPLDLGELGHQSLDVVLDANGDHNI